MKPALIVLPPPWPAISPQGAASLIRITLFSLMLHRARPFPAQILERRIFFEIPKADADFCR
ncbi:MAG: hypothetical protein PUI29_01845 [Aeromonadales bacterium]|nr:hypothetical protein [Aeromonadales bacterium]MDY2890736.1 hypothetical protein [Succinivibrio sp.]